MVKQIPILWKGKHYTAEHAIACHCNRRGLFPNEFHSWRIVDKQGRYLFDEHDPWVRRFATKLWSEDDPFMERAEVANGE